MCPAMVNRAEYMYDPYLFKIEGLINHTRAVIFDISFLEKEINSISTIILQCLSAMCTGRSELWHFI